MKDFVVRVYDFLTAHRWVAWTALALLVIVSGLLVTRMDYEEDISAFLPQDEQSAKYNSIYQKLGGQDRIAVFFTPEGEADQYEVMDAMDRFGSLWEECDTNHIVSDMQVCTDQGSILEVFGFISENWPYFLTEEDYSRMEELLGQPDYIREKIAQDRQSLNSIASAVTSRYLRTDPAGLFTPVLGRLNELNPAESNGMVDGYLFTDEGRTGVVFFRSPFGSSESGRNSELLSIIDEVVARTEAECPQMEISAVGGPIVAVGNANRIKKDSVLAVSLAMVLILLVLFFSYRRFSDVMWIAVSLLCGALFALGLISIFKSSISIIVLGIGAMIIGVAVNYPLHYIDHLKYQPDKRRALREQVTPLLVGNITTVGAFLGLLLMKAGALRDFGLVGALMLVGTILFVLLFLPALATGRKEKATNTLKLDFDRYLNPSLRMRRIGFFAFVALTLVFAVVGRKISFDSDMHNINYMTPDQSRGFAMLEAMGADASGRDCIYAVSEGSEVEAALQGAEILDRAVRAMGEGVSVSSISAFMPSEAEQARRLERWHRFLSEHPALVQDIRREAAAQGFAATAFDPFFSLMEKDWEVQPAEWFEPLSSTVGQSMFLRSGDNTSVVSFVRVDPQLAPVVKSSLSEVMPDGCFCFDSSDVSNSLVSLLSEDFDKIGLICSLIVFFFLWLSFGSLELSLMSFLPLAVGWVWILGIMQLTGLQFNIVNIILASFIFGMGDDYTIFITEGLMYEHACGKKILMSYKNSVALSALIMFLGIGVLVVARHPAMRSVGLVTVVGMFTVVVMAYYLPPLVFRWITTVKGQVREVPVTMGRILRSLISIGFFLLACLFIVPGVCVAFLLGPSTEKKKLRYHVFLQKLSKFFIYHIPGTRFSWSNPEGEDFSKPAVYICNHQSHFDVLAVMMLTPKVVILTNDWVWKNPFYGALIHRAEFYPASNGYDDNFPRLKDLVDRGYSILVYPEGTRNTDCTGVQRFHRGAFMLAHQLGLDVLPFYIHGFGNVLPKLDFMLRKGSLYMEVGKRIPHACIAEYGSCGGGVIDWRAVTRRFHSDFSAEYSRVRSEREDMEYWIPYVHYQYLYKGTEAAASCRRALSRSSISALAAFDGQIKAICNPSFADDADAFYASLCDCHSAQSSDDGLRHPGSGINLPALLSGTELPDGISLVSLVPGRIELSGCGYGVVTLLLALSYPDLEIVAHEEDEEKRLTASRCLSPVPGGLALPSNLSYLP